MPDFPGPITRKLLERAGKYCATTTADQEIVIVSGEGATVFDPDGFRFIDCQCDAAVNALGRNPQVVQRAIDAQQATGNLFAEHTGAPNPITVDLASMLSEKSPVRRAKIFTVIAPPKVFLASSGAEANEAARKLCLAFRKDRPKALYFQGGFAGRTGGVLAATSSKPEVQRDPFWTHCDKKNTIYAPFPRKNGDRKAYKDAFDKLPWEEINYLLIEVPCQGENGIIPVDELSLEYLYSKSQANDVIFIADCVQCGMGRVGTLFGCDIFPWLKPDILTLGKALAGGLPIGAAIFRPDLDWEKLGEHSTTFGGGPLPARVAYDVIKEIERLIKEEVIKKLEERLRSVLEKLVDYSRVVEVRGIGAMWGMEFDTVQARDALIRTAARLTLTEGCGLRLLGAGRKAIRIMPPLTITSAELDQLFYLLDKAMTATAV